MTPFRSREALYRRCEAQLCQRHEEAAAGWCGLVLVYVRCASCRYWGLRNVFIHTLIQYNRRYRKLGFESFLKNHRSFGKAHKDT